MQTLTERQARKREKVLLKKFKTLTRVMSPRNNITIKVSGDKAYTDYSNVVMPYGDFSNCDYIELLEGIIDHEIGHLKHSCKNVVRVAKKENLFLNGLRNAIEDVRMERLVTAEFPGARINIEKMVRQAMKRGWFNIPSADTPAPSLLSAYVLFYGRYTYCQQAAFSEHLIVTSQLLKNALGDTPFVELKNLMDTIPSLKVASDSLDLARDIMSLLKQEEQEQAQPTQGDEQPENNDKSDSSHDSADEGTPSDDSGQPESNNTDSSSDQSSDKNDNQDNQSGKSKGKPDPAQNEANTQSNSAGGNEEQDGGQNSPQTASNQAFIQACLNATEEAILDMHEQARKALEQHAKDAQNNGDVSRCEAQPYDVNRHLVSGELDEVNARRSASRVKQPLSRVLYDMNRQQVSFSKRGASVDGNRLATVKCGNHRVFRQEMITKAPNTAISILVDKSGSMRDPCQVGGFERPNNWKMKTANTAALALAKGIDALQGVKSEVLYYPFGSELHLAKAFDEKAVTKNFAVSACSGTPTGRSMFCALQRLALRKEPRKMLFVITDGSPGDVQMVEDMMVDAQALGIAVIAFGIGTNNVRGFDGQEVFIDDPSTLHLSVKDAIKANLLKVRT